MSFKLSVSCFSTAVVFNSIGKGQRLRLNLDLGEMNLFLLLAGQQPWSQTACCTEGSKGEFIGGY